MQRVLRFRAMARAVVLVAILIAACGGEQRVDRSGGQVSRYPVSVRGWVADVKGATRGETPEMEIARRQQLFQLTSIWVENTDYATGGIAENGAFVVLDVPPPTSTIGFNAPGAETAQLVLENIPPNADVFVPDVVLEPGGAKVADPSKIVVRVAGDVETPTPTQKTARVAGHETRVIEVPLSEMTNRRDFPNPGGFRPVAVVK